MSALPSLDVLRAVAAKSGVSLRTTRRAYSGGALPPVTPRIHALLTAAANELGLEVPPQAGCKRLSIAQQWDRLVQRRRERAERQNATTRRVGAVKGKS
jgi:hypothetical protein